MLTSRWNLGGGRFRARRRALRIVGKYHQSSPRCQREEVTFLLSALRLWVLRRIGRGVVRSALCAAASKPRPSFRHSARAAVVRAAPTKTAANPRPLCEQHPRDADVSRDSRIDARPRSAASGSQVGATRSSSERSRALPACSVPVRLPTNRRSAVTSLRPVHSARAR